MRSPLQTLAAILLMTVSIGTLAADTVLSQSYQFHISVSRGDGDNEVKLVSERVKVSEGHPTSFSVQSAGVTYTFDVAVDRQAGKLTASTKVKIVEAGAVIASPQVKQLVGQAASIETGALKVAIEVRQTKPRE